jgi:murein DD-endopeptidase MepM/ murein hydrolase activator NlpD
VFAPLGPALAALLVPGLLVAQLTAPTAALAPPPAPHRLPAAAAPRPPGPVPWLAPVAGGLVVLSAFDPPAETWLSGHRGVDLAAPPGTVVRAAGAGVVTWAGSLAGRGVVVVTHPDGRRTTYEPVTATVLPGEEVTAGEVLGSTAGGSSHCGAVPSCLHWGLRQGADYLDPMLLLDPGRPVLLPR